MKGFIFYLEYPNRTEKNKATRKNLGNHKGTCIAVEAGMQNWIIKNNEIIQECYASVFDRPDSECCFCSFSDSYKRHNLKNVSEETARKIHPNLFKRIELK